MAEREDDDLDLKPADAGTLFRAEMWATNAILGYWPYLLAVLVTGLLIFLFAGQYTSYNVRTQRGGSARVAAVLAELPAPVPLLGVQLAAGAIDTEPAELEAIGDRVLAAANQASGRARVEGLLKAAEVFRVAGATDKRRSTLLAASEGAQVELMRYAAESALATLDLEQGDGDAAVERLRRMMTEHDRYLAQQAALDLGLTLEQLGRDQEALQVYEEFLRTWTDSTRIEEVNERRNRVSG